MEYYFHQRIFCFWIPPTVFSSHNNAKQRLSMSAAYLQRVARVLKILLFLWLSLPHSLERGVSATVGDSGMYHTPKMQ